MAFPTEFPAVALNALISEVTRAEKLDPARLSLAVYELVGYGLFTAFGDVKFLMSFDPLASATANEILSVFDADTIATLKTLPWLAIAKDAYDLYSKGVKPPVIAVRLAFKYGFSLLPILTKIVTLVEKLRG